MRRSATVWLSVQSASDNGGFEPSNWAMCRGLLTSVQSASEIDTDGLPGGASRALEFTKLSPKIPRIRGRMPIHSVE